MGLLNHLFRSAESIAKEIELDDKVILKAWKEYLKTIPLKKRAVLSLRDIPSSSFPARGSPLARVLSELSGLLTLELTDISREERTEAELLSDLDLVEHSQKVKRVQRLEHCLAYAKTKYEYAYQLLHHLHLILQMQINLVKRLASSRARQKLISHLSSQLELELGIIAQIQKIKDFHNLFLALVKGEHIVHTMDVAEKKLLKKMGKEMNKIFSGETTNGITLQWVQVVFDAIEDKALEAVDAGRLEYHYDMNFEFVNRPEFVNLVRESRQKLSGRRVSEQMVTVFTHLFRKWYNHERD